ncbi:hypothetical protein [Pyrodictium delaneyi]|uniref:Uncharacterized protein n=1 Tax=Pyrodictium delaneyi TaxID=1273541 RepID=A0A211YRI7_9CREN|nr:hypothetical protein [Pyrodictium delaneyi]OWJ55581.1 hypothetical protein Pdsh_01995 [Pyrodictium delaneyi]
MRGQGTVIAAAIVLPILIAATAAAILKWQQMASVEELVQTSKSRVAHAAEMLNDTVLHARDSALVLVQTSDGQLLLRQVDPGETLALPQGSRGWILVGPAAQPLQSLINATRVYEALGEIDSTVEQLNSTLSQLSSTISAVELIANGYLDPLFVEYSDVLDPNSYRGYIYLGGYTLGPPMVQLRSPYVCIDYGRRTVEMNLMTISLPDGGSISVVGTKSSEGSDRVYVEWWVTWPNGTSVLVANITGSAWRSFSFTVGSYTVTVSGYFSWTRYTWCGEYTYIPWLYRVTIRIIGERSATLYISTTDVEWPVDWFRWTGSYRYDTINELAANQVLLVDQETLYCRQVQNYGASCVLVSSQLDKPVLTPGSASSIVYSVSSEATTSWTTCRCITVTNPGPSRYITVNFDGVWITLPPRTFTGSLFENP